jgi:hypothetical protein
VYIVRQIEDSLSGRYGSDLLASFQRRIVARATGNRSNCDTLLLAIDELASWATRLYEGRPIAAAIGLAPTNGRPDVTLKDICKEPFSPVLSNGFDTLLCFDFDGRFSGYYSLSEPHIPPTYAPYREGPIAGWAKDGRIAVISNRLGEILILRDQKLYFARRSGKWHFLTHEPVLTQMGGPDNKTVRQAVYESCLDASFARTGACVGLVTMGNLSKWKSIVTSQADHVSKQASVESERSPPYGR